MSLEKKRMMLCASCIKNYMEGHLAASLAGHLLVKNSSKGYCNQLAE